MNALQVLSDLSGIAVLGSMVTGAFDVQRISPRPSKLKLIPSCGCKCPFDLPLDAMVGDYDTIHFVFFHHTRLSGLPRLWPTSGDLFLLLSVSVASRIYFSLLALALFLFTSH